MRISAIAAHDEKRLLKLSIPNLQNSLAVIYGPPGSGKTELADLIGHALFAKRRTVAVGDSALDGELLVEHGNGRYRLRARHDEGGHTRLTIAAKDGGVVDHHTVQSLVGGFPPGVLTPMCAVNFRDPAQVGKLLSDEFRQCFRSKVTGTGTFGTRRVSELAARRDLLAQELESRIANDRRASKDFEARWRELDRLVRVEQQHSAAAEQRLRAVENSLAETDSRLRYRRLELNVELRWHEDESTENDSVAELLAQIARSRQTLAELSEREAVVRAKLAQTQIATHDSSAALLDQQRWLAVSRQLSADLTGEVARLARTNASQACVCNDAHPRLRPIAETIERQLDVLQRSIEEQRLAASARELARELDHLTRAQAELRLHWEHLLEQNQLQTRAPDRVRRNELGSTMVFSAADAEQLESRRLELEQERLRTVEQVNSAARRLKVLKAERDAVERERAALLSSRSIEHVQRELAHVQKKLEEASRDGRLLNTELPEGEHLQIASEYVAQLTDGELNHFVSLDCGRNVAVVNRHGTTVSLEMLAPSQLDQIYLSFCLAYLSLASREDISLPLTLDEPFARLDSRATAALAAVLADFCRAGHQALVFTAQKESAERLVAVGAQVHDLIRMRQVSREVLETDRAKSPSIVPVQDRAIEKRKRTQIADERPRRRKKIRPNSLNGEPHDSGHSDAA